MNFNLNSINKKIVLYLFLIGFILSFVSGLVTGNNFADVFVRSLVSGLVIGVIIIIVNIVIVIYLPELLEPEGHFDNDGREGDSHVNIVMPEEKYEVHTEDIDSSVDSGVGMESNFGNTDSSFREVDLDDLKSLSSSSDNNFNEVENFADNSSSFISTSSGAGEPDFGKHSVEDMTKAVKTVLKKD